MRTENGALVMKAGMFARRGSDANAIDCLRGAAISQLSRALFRVFEALGRVAFLRGDAIRWNVIEIEL